MWKKFQDYITYIQKSSERKKTLTKSLALLYALIAWQCVGLCLYQWKKKGEDEKRARGEDADFLSQLEKEPGHVIRYKGFEKVEEYVVNETGKVQIYRSPKLTEKINEEEELLSEGKDITSESYIPATIE